MRTSTASTTASTTSSTSSTTPSSRRSTRGDEDGFHATFEELLEFVRSNGEVLGDDDLNASDHILPPADLTFPEAGEEFTGDGLIPEPS